MGWQDLRSTPLECSFARRALSCVFLKSGPVFLRQACVVQIQVLVLRFVFGLSGFRVLVELYERAGKASNRSSRNAFHNDERGTLMDVRQLLSRWLQTRYLPSRYLPSMSLSVGVGICFLIGCAATHVQESGPIQKKPEQKSTPVRKYLDEALDEDDALAFQGPSPRPLLFFGSR